MIYSLTNKIGFIHIKRTGGTSIQYSLNNFLTNPVLFENTLFENKERGYGHTTAYWIKNWLLGEETFNKIQWYTVIRHPVEILTSYYSYINCRIPFNEYLRNQWFCYPHLLTHGGFLKTYCGDPENNFEIYKNIKIIKYSALKKIFNKEFPQLDLPRLNISKNKKPIIKKESEQMILDWCWYDIDYIQLLTRTNEI